MSAETLPPGLRDPARRSLSNPTIGDHITITKYSRETDGEYTRIIGSVRPGGGTPLHYHTSYTETFWPLKGELGVEIDGVITILKAGEGATIPIGAVHRFFNPSQDAECEFDSEIRPGHEGFEKFLYLMYGMAHDGLCDDTGIPLDKMVLALISDVADFRIAGRFAWLQNSMIKVFAGYKRWMGAEEELLWRYWYS